MTNLSTTSLKINIVNYMICIIIILIILLLFNRRIWENFNTLPVLTLEKTRVYNLKNWEKLPNNILTNEVTIKAKTGKIDPNTLMSIPQFGFPSLSGGNGYSNINRLQGTNGWDYYDEGRDGNKWFFWYILSKSAYEIKIKIILMGNSSPPVFPISYSVRVPDYYHKILTRFWITFTHNPFISQNINSISQPLLLDKKSITIKTNEWIKLRHKNTMQFPITASQGLIDYNNVTGPQKQTPTWFSWKLSEYNVQNENRIVISCKINNNYQPPTLPVRYTLKIKDKNFNTYINYIIIIV